LPLIAAMKSIIRREFGEDWRSYVIGVMQAEGAGGPDPQLTVEELWRFDENQEGKKVSNGDWKNPFDPDAELTKMKGDTNHLASNAENVLGIESSLIVGAYIGPASASDAAKLKDSLLAV
jgi:transposase